MDISGVNSNNYQPVEVPKKARQSEEITIASTDEVDSEIENLKNQQKKLSQKIKNNPAKRAELQQQLAKIEDELRQKDNDTYRRQHTRFSSTIDIDA